MFKVNNRNIRTRLEIYSQLAIKTPERHQWCLVSLLLTLNIFQTLPRVSIVNFEQVNVSWAVHKIK